MSLVVKALNFSESVEVAASLFSISWSSALSCGEKTSAKWRANNSTFSASLCAQDPGGVPFLRIGGRCRRGLFLDLIGF